MTDNIYHIISRREILGTKNEESKISYHNSLITTRNEKGLVILKISSDLSDVSKEMKFVESFVENPKSSATETLFPSNFMKTLKRNIDYAQTIHEPIFWPSNTALMEERSIISNFEWSPIAFTYNYQCILATLSNVGNVELLVYQKYGWMHCNCNVTKHYIDSQVNDERPSQNVQVLKKTLYKFASSSICWQSTINYDGSCNFVTAQKNGDIIIWGVKSSNIGLSIDIRCILETDNCEIPSLNLFEGLQNSLVLLYSNNYGQISSFKLNSDELSKTDSFTLWEFKDKMIVKEFFVKPFESNFIVCFYKNRHLVIQLLNNSCEIISQYVQNVNEYKISSIFEKDDNGNKLVLYLSTLNCKIYEVVVRINSLVLNVNIQEIRTAKDISSTDQDLQSLCYANKSGYLFVLLINRAVIVRTNLTKMEFFVMTDKSDDHFVSLILKNPSRSMTDIVECIEYLRVKVFKNRLLPSIDYKKIYLEGDSDIYKLKIYLYFLHYLYSLRNLFIVVDPSIWPEVSVEKVKEKIMFLSAKSNILEIYKSFNEGHENKSFIKESFVGLKKYLIFYCGKYKEDLNNHIPRKILNLVQEEYEYECLGCDKIIENFICSDGHPNTFCNVTFTLIESDKYLYCVHCSLTARIELLPFKPKCILCDSYLSMNCDDVS